MQINDIFTDKLALNWDVIKTIPEFIELERTPHSQRWHKEGNCIVHTTATVDWVHNKIKDIAHPKYREWYKIMITAALFHDIGKGTTTYWDETYQDWCCRNHGDVGAKIFRNIFFDEDIEIREKVCWLIRWHMLLHHTMMKPETKKKQELIQLMNGLMSFEDMLILHEADCRSSINDENTEENINEHITSIRKEVDEIKANGEHNLWKYVTDRTAKMYVMVGIPGSGKSTFVTKFIEENKVKGFISLPVVSRDIVRAELGYCKEGEKCKCSNYQESQVTQAIKYNMETLASMGVSFIIDNTSLKKKYRQEYYNLVKKYDITPIFIYVEAPSIEDNIQRRKGQITEKVIREMWEYFDFPDKSECYEMWFVDQRNDKITKIKSDNDC